MTAETNRACDGERMILITGFFLMKRLGLFETIAHPAKAVFQAVILQKG